MCDDPCSIAAGCFETGLEIRPGSVRVGLAYGRNVCGGWLASCHFLSTGAERKMLMLSFMPPGLLRSRFIATPLAGSETKPWVRNVRCVLALVSGIVHCAAADGDGDGNGTT